MSNLFTNVPLDFTINLILKKVYGKKMVKTKLKKEELKELLEMCTKELHFTFNDKIYQQTDGVCMGSPLGPVLANAFMVHLEETIVPKLEDSMPVWRRYVDDTFTLVKKGKLDEIVAALNNFHPNITFTHEIEQGGKMAFLDDLIKKKKKIEQSREVLTENRQTTAYTSIGMRMLLNNGRSELSPAWFAVRTKFAPTKMN